MKMTKKLFTGLSDEYQRAVPESVWRGPDTIGIRNKVLVENSKRITLETNETQIHRQLVQVETLEIKCDQRQFQTIER